MTINELITKGFEFAAAYVPNMNIYIDNGYVNEISPVRYENAVDAMEELKTIVKNFTESAEEVVILNTLYYYYLRENFALTDYKYKRVFELGRFLWYISIEKEEFLRDIKETLDTYL